MNGIHNDGGYTQNIQKFFQGIGNKLQSAIKELNFHSLKKKPQPSDSLLSSLKDRIFSDAPVTARYKGGLLVTQSLKTEIQEKMKPIQDWVNKKILKNANQDNTTSEETLKAIKESQYDDPVPTRVGLNGSSKESINAPLPTPTLTLQQFTDIRLGNISSPFPLRDLNKFAPERDPPLPPPPDGMNSSDSLGSIKGPKASNPPERMSSSPSLQPTSIRKNSSTNPKPPAGPRPASNPPAASVLSPKKTDKPTTAPPISTHHGQVAVGAKVDSQPKKEEPSLTTLNHKVEKRFNEISKALAELDKSDSDRTATPIKQLDRFLKEGNNAQDCMKDNNTRCKVIAMRQMALGYEACEKSLKGETLSVLLDIPDLGNAGDISLKSAITIMKKACVTEKDGVVNKDDYYKKFAVLHSFIVKNPSCWGTMAAPSNKILDAESQLIKDEMIQTEKTEQLAYMPPPITLPLRETEKAHAAAVRSKIELSIKEAAAQLKEKAITDKNVKWRSESITINYSTDFGPLDFYALQDIFPKEVKELMAEKDKDLHEMTRLKEDVVEKRKEVNLSDDIEKGNELTDAQKKLKDFEKNIQEKEKNTVLHPLHNQIEDVLKKIDSSGMIEADIAISLVSIINDYDKLMSKKGLDKYREENMEVEARLMRVRVLQKAANLEPISGKDLELAGWIDPLKTGKTTVEAALYSDNSKMQQDLDQLISKMSHLKEVLAQKNWQPELPENSAYKMIRNVM